MWRTITLAVALSGCNLVFGLHDTAPGDAPHGPDAPPDAQWPRLVLMRQVLDGTTIAATWSTSDPAPTTKVGPLAGALRDVNVDDDGGFLVPADLLTAPYRIVYQFGGGVPTEIQTMGTTGTFTVPLFGRAERTNAPPGAVIRMMANGGPSMMNGVRVVTTGLWTRKLALGNVSNPFDFSYNNAQSLSGPLGNLNGSRGDVEVLTAGNDPGGATSFAVVQIATLQPNATVMASGTWTTPTATSIAVAFNETVPANTLLGTLGSNLLGSGPNTLHDAGALASNMMPTFTEPAPGDLDIATFLPLWESAGTTSPLTFANPFDGGHAPAPMLPLAVSGRLARVRSYDGAQLTSGYQEIVTYGGLPVTVSYDVGLAKDVTLAGKPLSGNAASDGVAIATTGTTALPLVFATDAPVDDCIVTLSTIGSGVVTQKYRFLVTQLPTTQTPLQIDSTLLQPSGDYLFGIVCRRGSRTGMDYSMPSYPFRTSTLQAAVIHST